MKTENSVVSMYRISNDSDDASGRWEVDLPVQIKGSFGRTLMYGIVIGMLLAGPQIVAAFSNPSLPASNAALVSIVSSVLGLGAGIVAAFGLKRSV